jgi:excisionase family DNA binding protein
MTEPLKLLFTKEEAAHALGICSRTVHTIIGRGELQTRRIGKKVLIPRASLVKYAASDHPEPVNG